MKEAIEKFIAAIEKALPEYEVVDFRTPEIGDLFIPFCKNNGKFTVDICNIDCFKDESRFIVSKKWVPKVGELVATINDEGNVYFVQFKDFTDGGFRSMLNIRYLSPFRRITEEERKVLFPEEDSGLYVLVADRYSKDRHIIFEQYADESSLSKTRERQKNIDHKYGKTRIARLTFIEDWV